MLKFIITLLLLGISPHSPAATTPKVAIDIGHSKLHSGATSARGKAEFDFNLALAQVVQHEFSSQHIPAVLIGADGGMTELRARTASVAASGADFFLSLHHDSAQQKYFKNWQWQGAKHQYSDNFSGFSLFVSRKNPQAAKSLLCAQAIGKALQQKGFKPSAHHAEPVKGENREWADKKAGVYYYDDLIVLKSATIPAVLLEAGVIVNRQDELNLQTPATQHQIAKAIEQGLQHCKVLE